MLMIGFSLEMPHHAWQGQRRSRGAVGVRPLTSWRRPPSNRRIFCLGQPGCNLPFPCFGDERKIPRLDDGCRGRSGIDSRLLGWPASGPAKKGVAEKPPHFQGEDLRVQERYAALDGSSRRYWT